jgi:hypothetical protein
MKSRVTRKSITAGVLIASTIGLMVLIFGIFENAVGHGIAIASLAATATIVVFQSRTRAGKPATVSFSYISAAGIGVLVGFIPNESVFLQVAIGVTLLIVLLATFNRMHPPSVAYLFGFILGDYGFIEFFLTLIALAAFFVSLAVVVFVLEELVVFFGFAPSKKKKIKSKNFLELVDFIVDRAVPFSLVILFISVLLQFLYPDTLKTYDIFFSYLDWSIIALLILDLIFKFKKTADTKKFVKGYWLEILAVLPFFFILKGFEGVAYSLKYLTKGSLIIPVSSSALLRFLRPMARFPRFIRMLDNLDSLAGFEKK